MNPKEHHGTTLVPSEDQTSALLHRPIPVHNGTRKNFVKNARISALTLSMVAILLGLVALSCHDEGHLVDPAAAWQFTGGIIFELNAGSRASGICAIDPNEAIPKTHPLVPGAAEPRVSPDGKRLLQSRRPGNTFDLFVSNLDGTDARNLTNTGSDVSESDGDWSPDMQHVVCHALFYPSNKEVLRSVHTDGSGRFDDLTDTTRIRTVNLPRYSPEGTRIAYLAQDTLGGPWELTLIAWDGSSERRYGHSTLVHPLWSPDGKKLAYAGPTDHRLLVLDLPSGQSTPIGEGAFATSSTICWLSDERLVHGTAEGDHFLVKVTSFTPPVEVTTLASGFRSLEGLVLSPKGDSLAIIGRQEEGGSHCSSWPQMVRASPGCN